MTRSLRNSAGMSLMEILIVLGIIGGLMAFIIPQVMGNRDKSMIQETKVIMGSVIAQLNMYYTDCGKYPDSLDGLVAADASCSNWGPEPYFKKIGPIPAYRIAHGGDWRENGRIREHARSGF